MMKQKLQLPEALTQLLNLRRSLQRQLSKIQEGEETLRFGPERLQCPRGPTDGNWSEYDAELAGSCSFHMGLRVILPRDYMMQEIAETATHFWRPQELGKETADYFLILKIHWEENPNEILL